MTTPTDSLLLQARILYENAEITEVIDGGGFTIGKDTLTIRVNRMAWGLFEQNILKVMKDREDLRKSHPHLFSKEEGCEKCSGIGKFIHTPNTHEYDLAFVRCYTFDGKIDADAPPYGTDLATFCSPCQGTGLKLKCKKGAEL